jgi:hypothetical protein
MPTDPTRCGRRRRTGRLAIAAGLLFVFRTRYLS